MPNAPFRKYQTSGFAFEAYSFAVYSLEGSAHSLNLSSAKLEFNYLQPLVDNIPCDNGGIATSI